MDGDRTDVARLAALADRYNAFVYLDEAHATGVLGPRPPLRDGLRRRRSWNSSARSRKLTLC